MKIVTLIESPDGRLILLRRGDVEGWDVSGTSSTFVEDAAGLAAGSWWDCQLEPIPSRLVRGNYLAWYHPGEDEDKGEVDIPSTEGMSTEVRKYLGLDP
jgi:hypothetical protein